MTYYNLMSAVSFNLPSLEVVVYKCDIVTKSSLLTGEVVYLPPLEVVITSKCSSDLIQSLSPLEVIVSTMCSTNLIQFSA